jgi:ribonuclease HI
VAIVDKVRPDEPQSWRVIGHGRIDRIIEKRMGDIRDDDYEGHEQHATPDERLAYYRGIYGGSVGWDTPVKMIHFRFFAGAPASGALAKAHPRASGHVTLYADGGSRGNPGPSACGYVLLNDDGDVLVDRGVYLGITTNNQAEYQGLKSGLEEAQRMGVREVSVRLDSLLVVNQMNGVFKVKNRELWPVHDAIKTLLSNFHKITFTHVPRELNKLADAAVNRALDEHMPGRGLE